MLNISNYKVVAEAVRLERDHASGELYIVFQVVDEDFKKRLLDSWMDEVELEMMGTKLIKTQGDADA